MLLAVQAQTSRAASEVVFRLFAPVDGIVCAWLAPSVGSRSASWRCPVHRVRTGHLGNLLQAVGPVDGYLTSILFDPEGYMLNHNGVTTR